jgi:hypothetical protein
LGRFSVSVHNNDTAIVVGDTGLEPVTSSV